MGVAPDFGAEVDRREDGSGIDPDVMEDVGAEWGDEMEGVGVEVEDAGNVAKEVSFDKLLLGNPKFFSAVVDDGVLVWVAVDGEGAGGGGKKVGKDLG